VARFTITVALVAIVLGGATSCAGNAHAGADSRPVIVKLSRATVLLLPVREGGEGGWCLTTNTSECPEARGYSGPILAEGWSTHGPPAVVEGLIVTQPNVGAVWVDGHRVPTKEAGGLPPHLRAALPDVSGGPMRVAPGFGGLVLPSLHPEVVARDFSGRVIGRPDDAGFRLRFSMPSRAWTGPAPEARGVCEVDVRRGLGATALGGTVVTQWRPPVRALRRPFVTCAADSYRIAGRRIDVKVLADAMSDGRRVPASLPAGMEDGRGIFRLPYSSGVTLARRAGRVWVIVEGAAATAKLREVLLRTTVRMVGGA
jgi:hypothetical protein